MSQTTAKGIWNSVTGGIGTATGDIGSGLATAADSATSVFDWMDKYKWWFIGGAAVLGVLFIYKTFVPTQVVVERGTEGFGVSPWEVEIGGPRVPWRERRRV